MKNSRSVTIIITPILVQFFEWLWVFVDGTMFFGNITSQNNVHMDDLVSIFICITAACLFQLAQKDLAHLFNKTFVINKETQFLEKKESPQQFGFQVTALGAYTVSPFCLVNTELGHERNRFQSCSILNCYL